MWIWHDDLVRVSSPRSRPRIHCSRRRVLAHRDAASDRAPGYRCLRVRASLTISPDEPGVRGDHRCSKAQNPKDTGPQLDSNLRSARKWRFRATNSDGYVGSQAVFSDLTFAELPQLANMNSNAAGRKSVTAPQRQRSCSGRPGGPDLGDRSGCRRAVDHHLPRGGDVHQR